MCKKGPILALECRQQAKMTRADCGCWSCEECAVDLKAKWSKQAAEAFHRWGLIQVSCGTHQQTRSMKQRLNRQERQHMTIKLANGMACVFHQPLLKTRQYQTDRSTWLNRAMAIELFLEALETNEVKGVSRCKVLQIPVPRREPVWRLVEVTKKTPEIATEFLARLGLNLKIRPNIPFDRELLDVILLHGFPSDVFHRNKQPPEESSCSASSNSSRLPLSVASDWIRESTRAEKQWESVVPDDPPTRFLRS